jgi:hypothetical protein
MSGKKSLHIAREFIRVSETDLDFSEDIDSLKPGQTIRIQRLKGAILLVEKYQTTEEERVSGAPIKDYNNLPIARTPEIK